MAESSTTMTDGGGATGLVAQAAKDRIEGDRPGRLRALLAAAAAAAAAAAVTYKFLRSDPDASAGRMRAPRRAA